MVISANCNICFNYHTQKVQKINKRFDALVDEKKYLFNILQAAVDLAKLVEGTVFPAVSFGPISHALCRLVPSKNRTVASYSAKALKLLILDDALRPQALVAGVPAVVCTALKQWQDEV